MTYKEIENSKHEIIYYFYDELNIMVAWYDEVKSILYTVKNDLTDIEKYYINKIIG